MKGNNIRHGIRIIDNIIGINDPDIILLKRMQDKSKVNRYKYNLEGFKLHENNKISHNDWHEERIKGTGNVINDVLLINSYIDELEKPYNERNISFLEII